MIKAKDIFADHMTLEWKPPLDDGGTPVDHYVVEKFDPSLARQDSITLLLNIKNRILIKN